MGLEYFSAHEVSMVKSPRADSTMDAGVDHCLLESGFLYSCGILSPSHSYGLKCNQTWASNGTNPWAGAWAGATALMLSISTFSTDTAVTT